MKTMGNLDPCRTFVVLVPPDVIAGTETTLRMEVEAPADVLAMDQSAEIRDRSGQVIGRAVIPASAATEGTARRGVEVAISAPASPGTHQLNAHLAPLSTGGIDYAGVEVDFRLDVASREVSVAVFDLPSAVERGADFSVTIGASCGTGFDLTGWRVTLRDRNGAGCASAEIGSELWPGTDRLRYATLNLTAPDTPGLARWEATVAPPSGRDAPHESGSRSFSLRVTEAAKARLIVEAVDGETGQPARGVKVVAGPFRTLTDESGRAELAVTPGTHRVFVSGKTYFPFQDSITVEDQATLRVTLHPDLGPSDQLVWG